MNPDLTTAMTASSYAVERAGRIVPCGRNPHAAACAPRLFCGACEEPNHLAPREGRTSILRRHPFPNPMSLPSIFTGSLQDTVQNSKICYLYDSHSLYLLQHPAFTFRGKKKRWIIGPSAAVETNGERNTLWGVVRTFLPLFYNGFDITALRPAVPDVSKNAGEAVVFTRE